MSAAEPSGLDRLDRNVVHEICTNQVVVTLHACVKELVENSLDAGATRIEVRLRESGSELLEVVDNGHGIASDNYANLAARHATSKIRDYDDLSQSLSTFGFRGEALSAIAAMGDMTVCTRTAGDAAAALLSYDRFGKLASQVTAARETGTTVSVRELFRRLPVRHREFLRNAKSQVGATLRLIQSYAIAQPEIRFHVVAEKTRGYGAGRATLLSTSGSVGGWRQAAAAVLGDAVTVSVEPFELHSEKTGWDVSGLISTPMGGRRNRDSQLYFVNRRPIDPPKRIAKLVNDTYHQYNSRMWPVVILSFTAGQSLVDVNVTPDKRTVFLHNEETLLAEIQETLTTLFTPKVQGAGPGLADFGIRGVPSKPAKESNPAVCDAVILDEASTLSASPNSAPSGCTSTSPSPSSMLGAASTALEATTPEPMEPPRRSIQATLGGLHTPEKPSSIAPEAGVTSSGGSAEEPLPGFAVVEFSLPSADIDKASAKANTGQFASKPPATWTQPLQQQRCSGRGEQEESSQPEFRIIELDPSTVEPGSYTEVTVADEPASITVVETHGMESNEPGIDVAMDDGFTLTEEYHPNAPAAAPPPPPPPPAHSGQPPSSSSRPSVQPQQLQLQPQPELQSLQQPSLQQSPVATSGVVAGVADEVTVAGNEPSAIVVDDAESGVPEPRLALPPDAVGCTIRASVTLAELGAAVARRRHRASRPAAAKAASTPSVHFPSAFSLSSLRAEEQKRSSLEEVAKFATDSGGGPVGHEAGGMGLRFDKSCFSQMRVIGQFNLGFIIAALKTTAKEEEGQQDPVETNGLQLFIIDQHASDEKFRFEGLNRESRIDRQPLVTPHHLQLTPAQEQLAESHLEVFRLNGFELRREEARPPGRRLQLATLPTCQGLVFGERDIHDLLYTLEEAEPEQQRPSGQDMPKRDRLLDLGGHRGTWSSTALPRPAKVWQLLACRACRGAVMIGKALRVGEMERILANLGSLEQPWNCPHGRPTMRHLIDTAAARKAPRSPPPLSRLLAQAAP